MTVYGEGIPDVPTTTDSGEVAEAEHVGRVDVDDPGAIDATHAGEATDDEGGDEDPRADETSRI